MAYQYKGKRVHNLGMNIYCFNREYLINLIDDAFIRGNVYLERDILANEVDEIKIYGHKYEGYCSRICDMKSYFQENLNCWRMRTWKVCLRADRFIQNCVMTTRHDISMVPL